MLLKDIIVFALISFLVYRVLNRYVLPLLRVTTAASSSIRQMKEQMQQMKDAQHSATQPNINNSYTANTKRPVEKEGDYIDYEEVK